MIQFSSCLTPSGYFIGQKRLLFILISNFRRLMAIRGSPHEHNIQYFLMQYCNAIFVIQTSNKYTTEKPKTANNYKREKQIGKGYYKLQKYYYFIFVPKRKHFFVIFVTHWNTMCLSWDPMYICCSLEIFVAFLKKNI